MNFDFNKMDKEKHMNDLSSFIDRLINERNSLAEKLNSYDKDERITKLLESKNILLTNSLHIFTESERQHANKFQEKHWRKCKSNIRYILEGTGIGTGVIIQCIKCDTKKDITDMENW